MNSILKLRESDPHDDFGIAPDIVPATWADKVLADIEGDGKTPSHQPQLAQTRAAGTAFRETAAGDFKVPDIDIDIGKERPAGRPSDGSRMKKGITVFLFALCSALAAASWHHYGAAAKQMISAWVPPLALTSPARPEPTGLTAQSDTADAADTSSPAQASDQAAPQPASAQAADGAAAAAAAPSPDAAQMQSMARDLAAMGQEVQLLKATIAELKAGQQASAARSADAKPAEIRPAAVPPRPRVSAPPPPRPVAPVAARRPMQAYPAYPPVQAAAPPPQQIAPPPPAMTQADDGEPVVRPPMPLR